MFFNLSSDFISHKFFCCWVIRYFIYEITRVLRTLWLDEPHFLSDYRHGWHHFHFVLEYRDMNDMTDLTKTRENLGYFMKQIKNCLSVSHLCCDRNMNDAISTGKMPSENTRRSRVFSGIFLVGMTSFVCLSLHRDTQVIFHLWNTVVCFVLFI